MKGHCLGDVEGMWRWRQIHEVQLLRPLLQRRKKHFVELLEEFPTPHFRDSTPGGNPWDREPHGCRIGEKGLLLGCGILWMFVFLHGSWSWFCEND